jgi:uncharacterized membrane protein YccF (DUF307 family)
VSTQTARAGGERSLLVRAAYFLLVGWWLTGLWLSVAWLLVVSVLLLPVGIKTVNRVPFVLTLKDRRANLDVVDEDGTVVGSTAERYPLPVRAAYFLLVGWWASGVWTGVAYGFAATIVGLPLAVWMFDRLPFVVSLYRY